MVKRSEKHLSKRDSTKKHEKAQQNSPKNDGCLGRLNHKALATAAARVRFFIFRCFVAENDQKPLKREPWAAKKHEHSKRVEKNT